MNSELAQLVFLTAHGNAAFIGVKPSEEALRSTSAFAHVNSVRFVEHNGDRVAGDPVEWFSVLQSNQASRLWLRQHGTRTGVFAFLSEAFSGGVARSIYVSYPNHTEVWSPHWAFHEAVKKWEVAYYRNRRNIFRPRGAQPLRAARDDLSGALEEAVRFARQARAGGWADFFSRAAAFLREAEDISTDLLPQAGYTDEARRLLSAADHAWAFGGMGSWNDLGFDDPSLQADYERITKSLYDAVIGAILAATNSFDPSIVR